MYESVFIDDSNKAEYSLKVLTWLEKDYNEAGQPDRHFWYNRNIISDCFEQCKAMVAIDTKNNTVGFMVWSMNDVSAEIEIVEVHKQHRRCGIYKMMLADFSSRFDNVCVLTGSIIPEAIDILTQAGWQTTDMKPYAQKHYKIIKAGLQAQPVMPNGRVIALCSTNFYQVQRKPEDFQDKMRYFSIELDDEGNLKTPIIAEFHYEGYVGVFFNKTLVAQQKAKYLFENRTTDTGLFILGRIEPKAAELRQHDAFFDVHAEQQPFVDDDRAEEQAPKVRRVSDAHASQGSLGFFANVELGRLQLPELEAQDAGQPDAKKAKK